MQIKDLQEFNSNRLHSSAIESWLMSTLAHIGSSQTQFNLVSAMAQNSSLKAALFGDCRVKLAPLKKPPNYKVVKDWIRSKRVHRLEKMADENKDKKVDNYHSDQYAMEHEEPGFQQCTSNDVENSAYSNATMSDSPHLSRDNSAAKEIDVNSQREVKTAIEAEFALTSTPLPERATIANRHARISQELHDSDENKKLSKDNIETPVKNLSVLKRPNEEYKHNEVITILILYLCFSV